MSLLKEAWSRLASLFRRRDTLDRDLDVEMESHLALSAAEYERRGMDALQAREAALREFGSVAQVAQVYRERRGIPLVETVARDTKYAVRQLRKSPGFTTAAILTLALGIGTNAAVFSVLNSVLLQPLPFKDRDRLVMVQSIEKGEADGPSAPDVRDFAERSHSFEELAPWDTWNKNVTTSSAPDAPVQMQVGLASREFFDALGLEPIMGRKFTAQDAIWGNNHVALITRAFWQTRFGGRPDVLGQTMTINGNTYTVIGVLSETVPDWFRGVDVEVWEPFAPIEEIWDEYGRGGRGYGALGKLREGVTLAQAQADLSQIASELAEEHPVDRDVGVLVKPLTELRAGKLRPTLYLLMGSVVMILLIACSNLAGLLLARNGARQREFALRSALGAGRTALIRQILTETVLLSLAGGAIGAALAWGSARILKSSAASIAQLHSLEVDWRVAAFTFVAALCASLLFGLAPALLGTRVDLVSALKEGGRGAAGSSRQYFRRGLVVAQIALSLVLMIGAGLLAQTIAHLENQDIGYYAPNLVKASFYLPPLRYPTGQPVSRFAQEYRRRVQALPGVKAASITMVFPPVVRWTLMFRVQGQPVARVQDIPTATFGLSDNYFLSTAGIPLRAGRDFAEDDRENTAPVAIVNETFARRFFGGESAIGKTVVLGAPAELNVPDPWLSEKHLPFEIVGVMGDWKNEGLAEPVKPMILALGVQVPDLNFGWENVLLRTEANSAGYVPELQRQLGAMDAQVPIYHAETMDAYISRQTADRKLITGVLAAFAALGVMLALIGVYGVIAYLVVQRRQEIAIRVALGASRRDVTWLVTRQGLQLAIVGVCGGIVATLIAGGAIRGLLYGVSPTDLRTLALAAAVLAITALVASWIPGRRAMNVDPIEAMRAN